MSVNSAINNLVGTFTENNAVGGVSNTTSCICFDTSTNRIGINTISPAYAIDVSQSETSESGTIKASTIKTDYLILKGDDGNYYNIKIANSQVITELHTN